MPSGFVRRWAVAVLPEPRRQRCRLRQRLARALRQVTVFRSCHPAGLSAALLLYFTPHRDPSQRSCHRGASGFRTIRTPRCVPACEGVG